MRKTKTKIQNRFALTEPNSEQTRKPVIAVVTIPIAEAGLVPLSNLIDVLDSFTENIYLITSHAGSDFFKDNKRVQAYGVGSKSQSNMLIKSVKNILAQISISYRLTSVARDADWWCFFIGGSALLLPMLTGKLLRKKVMLVCAGSDAISMKSQSKIVSKVLEPITKATASLSDRIVIYSQGLIKEYDLEKHQDKISIACERFIDFDTFKLEKAVIERNNMVGYIGRLSSEKGILNFVRALPMILDTRDDITFLIGGDGQLRDKVQQYVKQVRLDDRVKFAGWIAHYVLPKYLNQLKLLVLPSHTEGLPTIALEAMACGTPVLATPVGAVPDIITDGETGFIMEDNSPECIARNISRALSQPNLHRISRNAYTLVKAQYSYEATVEKFRTLLSELTNEC